MSRPRWRWAIAAPSIAVALLGCASESGTTSPEQAITIDNLSGTWRNTANVLSLNTCPIIDDNITGVGGFLVVDKTDAESGYARICPDVSGEPPCMNRGLVAVVGNKAYHFSADTFGPYYGLDCTYTQVAVSELTRSGNTVTASVTSSIAGTVGDQCRQLQARLQQESGTSRVLKGCWIKADYAFLRAPAP